MQSKINKRGETLIPAQIRALFQLTVSDRLEWSVDETGIRLIPIRQDPVAAFRGQGAEGSTQRLLEDRGRDRR
jgi:bifunctional DNA-binding transcriptional regulator/antitoxin component of YhaV-PrlF toxin-antitoxin module